MAEKKSPTEIFTKEERAFILEEMAFLKKQEIDNGDRAKWEKSQKILGIWPIRRMSVVDQVMSSLNDRYIRRASDIPYVNVTIEVTTPLTAEEVSRTGARRIITEGIFYRAVGYPPRQDDLVRCNCDMAGQYGHWHCGWCEVCDKPVFICGHSPIIGNVTT